MQTEIKQRKLYASSHLTDRHLVHQLWIKQSFHMLLPVFVLPSVEHQTGGVYRGCLLSCCWTLTNTSCTPGVGRSLLTESLYVFTVRVSSVSDLSLRRRWRHLFSTPVRASALNQLVRERSYKSPSSFHAALASARALC